MDILCLMGLFPNEYRNEIQKDSVRGMQNAADKLQWAIVKGLSTIDGLHVSIVNSLYIGSFPSRYRRMMIPSFEFSACDNVKGINVGFCNLTWYKQFSKYRTAKKAVKAWAEAPGNGEKVLLVYALTGVFTRIAAYVKKEYKHIKVCFVVPDLPEYMRPAEMQRNGIYKKMKDAAISRMRKDIREVDCYVFLTDTMKEWFDYPVKYTVVEGIAADTLEVSEIGTRNKTIIYAGGISEAYGVVDLVRSFLSIDALDWELVLYGDGGGMGTIRELAADHTNVHIMGLTPNKEVVAALRSASVLVNPRRNHPFTRYSFPSKIMEYMASGTPVLAYKLDGIPDEYDPFYYRISETDDGMEQALRRVMALTDEERAQMGVRAKQFVTMNKNPASQGMKIAKLLQEVVEESEAAAN